VASKRCESVQAGTLWRPRTHAESLLDHLPCCTCCSALGNIPGVPKVHYKGRQGDFYIMVRSTSLPWGRLP